jgi:cell fate (sporulation/competence/biofilm development) regulator YmcA (YheA/YmcA/DUF963 family)
MKRIQSKAETMAWRSFAVVSVLALGWFVFIYGEGSATVIVEKILGYETVEDSRKIQQEFKKRDAKLQLDLEVMKTLQAESDALNHLKKLQRSARTEKELAFVRSGLAKLQALGAERERTVKAAKAELERIQ